MGYLPYQLVQDCFHQQYLTPHCFISACIRPWRFSHWDADPHGPQLHPFFTSTRNLHGKFRESPHNIHWIFGFLGELNWYTTRPSLKNSRFCWMSIQCWNCRWLPMPRLVHLGLADHQGDSSDGTLNGHCFCSLEVSLSWSWYVWQLPSKKHSFKDENMFKSLKQEMSVNLFSSFLWETIDYTSVSSSSIFPLTNLKLCFVAKKTNAGEDTRNLGSYDTVHFLVVFTAS